MKRSEGTEGVWTWKLRQMVLEGDERTIFAADCGQFIDVPQTGMVSPFCSLGLIGINKRPRCQRILLETV